MQLRQIIGEVDASNAQVRGALDVCKTTANTKLAQLSSDIDGAALERETLASDVLASTGEKVAEEEERVAAMRGWWDERPAKEEAVPSRCRRVPRAWCGWREA